MSIVALSPNLARAALLLVLPIAATSAQCPISYGNADAAKPNKLYLYFPTVVDRNFPEFGDLTPTCPVNPFDVGDLQSPHGDYPQNSTTAELRDAIFNVVAETFCEFNVQVIQTTTPPPTTSVRREIVAIGTDDAVADWGRSEYTDFGDNHPENFARVWAGRYIRSDALNPNTNPANSTVERWARSIGGTCAHEAGHGYGLDHGTSLAAGEDAAVHHLMGDGNAYNDEDRARYRHFSNKEYSLLASNVGLAIQTMWNWDLVNPNAETAAKLRMDFLSTQPTLPILSWSYSGPESPWVNPTVTGPLDNGNQTWFKGTPYFHYQIEWATGQNWNNGPSGKVPGGVGFHVGATFSSINFSAPDPIIITNATLVDENGPLALHPRLLGFDSGTFEDGVLHLRFFNTQRQPLSMRDLVVQQLPRVLSLDEMVQGGGMRDPHGIAFRPWPGGIRSIKGSKTIPANDGEYKVALANLKDNRHIFEVVINRSSGGDSTREPDVATFVSGINVDLFPATTVYITGTVVDPEAKYWDQGKKKYVTGPLESRFYYQIAGRHPDLNENGIDDYVEIATGKVKDTRVRGVPDDVKATKVREVPDDVEPKK